jgi:hypothetical protein
MCPLTVFLLHSTSHYNGAEKGAQPLAFVGKGITFDSGGISIKPSAVRTPFRFRFIRVNRGSVVGDETDARGYGYALSSRIIGSFNILMCT